MSLSYACGDNTQNIYIASYVNAVLNKLQALIIRSSQQPCEVVIIISIFRWETEAQRASNLLRVTELVIWAVWPQSLCLAVNSTASML